MSLAVFAVFCIGFVAADDTWKVTTIAEKPYVTSTADKGRFEGYIPDLLDKIASKTKKNFTISLVADGKYGANIGGNDWNGMIGEVMAQKAHVAAAPITISADRELAIDFTETFMTFDTVVLLQKTPETAKIRSVNDLVSQTDIKYGVVKDGFTENFFKTTDQDIYKKMYTAMMAAKNGDFPLTSGDGVRKVKESNGKYAFVIDSSTADYWMQQKPCNLVSFRLGSALPVHKYAFAVRKGATELKKKLDDAIKELQSKGELDELKTKWWPNECSGASGRAGFSAAALGLVLAAVAAAILRI